MFNNYTNKNNVNINAVSGTIVKNHPNSIMRIVKIGSYLSDELFSSEPYYKEGRGSYSEKKTYVIVLQSMICGDGMLLCEIVDKDKYILEEKK